MNFLQSQPRHRLLAGLALLLVIALVSYRQVAAQPAATELVAGSYAGTVTISKPAPLGDLDLLLEITNANGVLSGQVNAIKTQVFLGGPTFTGSITTSGVVTPTVRIESQTFSGTVSGRTVQRHFVLTGEVLNDGDTLRGIYTETIVGFKPQPMLVEGTFLLARPSGVTAIITVPTPRGTPPSVTPDPGGAPTPTATSTVPPGNNNGSKLYLPLVQRAAAVHVGAAVAEETRANDAATPTPTATLSATETPTPTPLVLVTSPGLTTTEVLTTTEAQQQIHLPLIMH